VRSLYRLRRVLRSDWPRLFVELVVLVAGITISFALDEWRREREERRHERRLLEAIRDDLAADSAYLATRIGQLERMVSAYDGLLTGGPRDSLDSYMDQAITYVVFTRTDNAYQEVRMTGNARLLRNRELFARLVNAYNREYVRAAEWDAIGRDFVLQRMIPYLDATAPYVASSSINGTALGLRAVYDGLAGRDHFRNLVRTNRLFKEAQLSVYRAALARAVEVRSATADELRRRFPGSAAVRNA
jgi:hypothetical protein